ncbi:transposase [Candidatus Enterovibrio escicola]|uniref:transposase n=1 Tax=Candidatus Enterovibrio escicola TaxID=1927127 RepID=UPI001CC31475
MIFMNNSSLYKRIDTLEAIEAPSCTLEWLPPYNPDCNPIKHKWAEVKSIKKERSLFH